VLIFTPTGLINRLWNHAETLDAFKLLPSEYNRRAFPSALFTMIMIKATCFFALKSKVKGSTDIYYSCMCVKVRAKIVLAVKEGSFRGVKMPFTVLFVFVYILHGKRKLSILQM
jgi:hypothetical protein